MSILDQKPQSPLKEGFGTKFGIGLILALSLSLAAFQIRAPYSTPPLPPIEFSEDDGFKVEQTFSHSREKTVDPPPPVKPPERVNIVVGNPMPEPGPEPIGAVDLNTMIPVEFIHEPPVPEPVKPTRFADKMPVFPGGTDALMDYLRHTPYCDAAVAQGYQGKVYVEFVVDKDGKVQDIKLLNKLYPCVDQMVINRIKNMPVWEPGYQGENAVPVIMVATFKFVAH